MGFILHYRKGARKLATVSAPVQGFSEVKIGAGGFVQAITFADDGTQICRNDTYGAHKHDGSRWNQLVTMSSMPSGFRGITGQEFARYIVNEIAFAPSNSSRVYMIGGGNFFSSTDGGVSFSHRSGYGSFDWPVSNSTKAMGPQIAVDPANPDRVYAGTPENGLKFSSDGGLNWSTISAVGTGSDAGSGLGGGHCIVYDRSSSVVGNVTQRILVSTYGTGVYESTNGGSSWTLLTGGPTTHWRVDIGADGVYWHVSKEVNDNGLWKRQSGAWTNFTSLTIPSGGSPGSIWCAVACDPDAAGTVVVSSDGGAVKFTLNNGTSFSAGTHGSTTRIANDIPWLEWTTEDYFSMASSRIFDGELWVAQGIGVWKAPMADLTGSNVLNWLSVSAGIEQMVANDCIIPPGGKPVVAMWDRESFYIENPDVYRDIHGMAGVPASGLSHGWSLDFAAAAPNVVVGVSTEFGKNRSGKSTDGGRTWTAFPTSPTGLGSTYRGGCIVAVSATNYLIIPMINSPAPYWTKNSGTTWTLSAASPVPTTGGEYGWGSWFANSINHRRSMCVDKSNGDVYAYNIGVEGDDTFAGVYKSTDGGENFTRVYSGIISLGAAIPFLYDAFQGHLRAVPGQTGKLFWSGGHESGVVQSGPLYRSNNSGVTWSAVPGVTEVYDFGFGAAPPGSVTGWPSMFIAGNVGGTAEANYGIWQSDNMEQATPTWARVGGGDGWPLGNFDHVKCIAGHPDVHGEVYVGTHGTSFFRYGS